MATERSISGVEPDSSASSKVALSLEKTAELQKNLNAYAIMAYVAVADRNAMAEQLRGLEHLQKAVTELQEKKATAEAQAERLQMEVWSQEAFVTRSQLQLRTRDDQILSLGEEIKKLKGKSPPTTPSATGAATAVASGGSKEAPVRRRDMCDGDVSTDKQQKAEEATFQVTKDRAARSKESRTQSPKPIAQEDRTSQEAPVGVSREIHEAVVQENIHLKNNLQQLIGNQPGLTLKDLTDTIRYKEIIKQLKRKIGEKDEEMAKVIAALNEAKSPEERTAKRLLAMQGKVNEAERTINMKQVMIEALSKRCEELKRALEQCEERQELKMAYMRSPYTDSTEAMKNLTVEDVLPSVEIRRLTAENRRLQKLHEHQATENEGLRKDLVNIRAERQEFHSKLAALMKSQQCIKCQELTAEKERIQQSLDVAMIQAESYKEDYQRKCQEMEKGKGTYRNEVDVWKKNCHTLSQQIKQFREELGKQMTINSQLQAQSSLHNQELKHMSSYRSMSSMPVMQQSCGEGVLNPWQESHAHSSMPSEVAVGKDNCDLASNQDEWGIARTHGSSDAHPSSSRRRKADRKLQCISCNREFPVNRQADFEEHQQRCGQNP